MGMLDQLVPKPTYHQKTSTTVLLLLLAALVLPIVLAIKFVTGLELFGEATTDRGLFHAGTTSLTKSPRFSWWASRPLAVRAGIRLGVTAGVVVLVMAYAQYPTLTTTVLAAAAAWGLWRAARRAWELWSTRKFRRYYLKPLAAVLLEYVGYPEGTRPEKFVTVAEGLDGLAPPPTRPVSLIEDDIRGWYVRRIQPAVQWLPNKVWRWRVKRVQAKADEIAAAAAEGREERVSLVDRFRRPVEEKQPSIEVRGAKDVFFDKEKKAAIRERVTEKLGLSGLEERWDQKGHYAYGTWTVIKRPPEKVGWEEMDAVVDELEEHQFFIGLDSDGMPATIDLKTQSPHIACSASTGAGKSALAKAIASQVLRYGGRVYILDIKGSHMWAKDLEGVVYCRTAKQMHEALIALGELALERNNAAFDSGNEDYDPGHRVFVIFEEMNATLQFLKRYWDRIKEKGEKGSPAIDAFNQILFMGRAAKVNVFAVAQMLTARATGGPEARENFGVRCLSRYTAQNWKMLAPECKMPKKSKVLGRWQIVSAGTAKEVQVVYLDDAQAREMSVPVVVSAGASAGDVAGVAMGSDDGNLADVQPRRDGLIETDEVSRHADDDPNDYNEEHSSAPEEVMTLREAINAGYLSGTSYGAIKKRLDREAETDPDKALKPLTEKRGKANLYRVFDLMMYAERQNEPAEKETE